MPHVYKALANQFSCVQEFQEKAVRFLNELYGRRHPLETFDFAEAKNEEGRDIYIATAYHAHEELPAETKVGKPLSKAQKKVIAETPAVEEPQAPAEEAVAAPASEAAPAEEAKPVAPEKDKAKSNGKKRK